MATLLCPGLLLGGLAAHARAVLLPPASNEGIDIGDPVADSDCTCLPWIQAYELNGVPCGQGLEYFFSTRRGTPWPRANLTLGDEFCRRFFRRIPDNFCMNADMSDEASGIGARQWCYVSSRCERLRGGRRIPGADASWKLCQPDQDAMLRESAPEDLDRLRASRGLSLGLLAKYAYPVWQSDRWPAVQHLFLGPQPGAEPLAASGRSDLQRVVSEGKAMVFNSASGHPPFHIVLGRRVYKIDFKPGGQRSYREGRMGEVSGLQCIQGC